MPYKNPAVKAAREKWRRETNPQMREISRRASAKYREKKENKQRIAAYNAEYKRANRHKATASEKQRRARLINATPQWLTEADKRLMEGIYEMAAELTYRTKIPHHVDHIVPLRSPHVCGLHVPNNLQVITEEANQAKSNRLIEPRIQ